MVLETETGVDNGVAGRPNGKEHGVTPNLQRGASTTRDLYLDRYDDCDLDEATINRRREIYLYGRAEPEWRAWNRVSNCETLVNLFSLVLIRLLHVSAHNL